MAYSALLQILVSYSPRIREFSLVAHHWHPLLPINIDAYRAVLQFLAEHDFPDMDRLEMRSYISSSDAHDLSHPQLLHRIITRSVSLKNLALRGYEIDWRLSLASEGLKSLEIHGIPVHLQPSMAQLSCFLSRVPLLETLSLGLHPGMSFSNAEHVHMEYLKELKVSCQSPAILGSFFECLTFPEDSIITADLDDVPSPDMTFIAALRNLTIKLDNITSGPILELACDRDSVWVRCWKRKQRRSEGEPPSLVIECHCPSRVTTAILRSLCLDRLMYLEMNELIGDARHEDAVYWSSIGTLPQLIELKAVGFAEP
ncbi:hypothetical protein H0H92_000222, partial [Tricholoma furcatifolium]